MRSRSSVSPRRSGSPGTRFAPAVRRSSSVSLPRGVDVAVPGIEFLSDKSLRGTYYGSGDAARDLPGLAELALAGELDLSGVVSHTTDLDGVEDALERLRRGEGARTVVLVDPVVAGAP